jgi:predicted unusual protein kinase regulating ubiquinone biosynthesis (AarF/ABC1/UbiB family)
MTDRVVGSRLRRLGRMAWMSRKAVPLAVGRMRQKVAGRLEGESAAYVGAAEELLRTLGELKGLALKAGQMLSYMDGALPADAEPAFRRILSQLQQRAPALPWPAVSEVLALELGSLDDHFAAIEEEPFAAASIGQVHRARLHDGTPVAVKVQYPGIAQAMSADLANMDTFELLVRPMFGLVGAGQNMRFAKSVMQEIRARMEEELDYEHEARMQARFREQFADTPGVVVPEVFPEHSTARVLTTRFEPGKMLDEVADVATQDLRDRWGEVLCRAVTDELYVHRLFNADPHPGNYLFRDDGSVVLLDFGCIKEIPGAMADDMKAYLRAAIVASRTDAPEDWRAYEDAVAHALHLREGDPEVAEFYSTMLLFMLRPLLRDEPFAFEPQYVAELNDRVVEHKKALVFGKGRLPRIPKLPPMPGDYTFINRLQWGFYSVLTRLRARVNWHRLLPAELREP